MRKLIYGIRWYLYTLLLSLGLLFLFVTLVVNKNPDAAFLCHINADYDNIFELRNLFSSGNTLWMLRGVRDIICNRFDLLYVLALLIPDPWNFLIISYFIRFAVAGCTMFGFLSKSVQMKNLPALFLAEVYVFMPVSLIFMAVIPFANMMIFLPLVLMALNHMLEDDSLKNMIIFAAVCSIFYATGAYALCSGLPFVLAFAVFLMMSKRASLKKILIGFGGTVLSQGIAVLMCSAIIIPRHIFASAVKVSEVYVDEKPMYSIFDFVMSLADGRSIQTADYYEYSVFPPALMLSTAVLLLVVLFFLNKAIPYQLKIATIIMALFFHARMSYPFLSKVLSIYYGNLFKASAVAMLAMFLIFVACISFHNLGYISESNLYISIVIIIALLAISNNSSAIIMPNPFSLWFTGIVTIILASVLLSNVRRGNHNYSIYIVLALFAMLVNTYISSSKAIIHDFDYTLYDSGNVTISRQYSTTFTFEEINTIVPLQLFDGDISNTKYVVLDSDAVNTDEKVEVINQLPYYVTGDLLFMDEEAEIMYANGFEEHEDGSLSIVEPGTRCEVIIFDELSQDNTYMVYSSFSGVSYLADALDDEGNVISATSPFILPIPSKDGQRDIRLAMINPAPQVGFFKLYRVNQETADRFNDLTYVSTKNKITVSERNTPFTIITSIPYDRYSVKGPGDITVFDYNNYVGFEVTPDTSAVASGEMMEFEIVPYKIDIIYGPIFSVATVALIAAAYIYVINKDKKNVEANR